MIFRKLKKSISEARAQEHMAAKVEKQEALLEYVAIMADIELPSEEAETMNGSEVPDYE